MGGVILSPSAMPASTGLSEAPAPTPAGDINFGRLFQRDEDTAQILITQTVTRSWTTFFTPESGICIYSWYPPEPSFSFNLAVFPFFGSSRASAREATSRLFWRLQGLVRRRCKAG
ncbi:hypothetical protein K4K54_009023 [Colletotrichum sp. SAR 10_86]|nr:hypothetical protein K4K54_009023 [Colletotrichum sp. SAR 10_86]